MKIGKTISKAFFKLAMKLPAPLRRRIYLSRCDLLDRAGRLEKFQFTTHSNVEDMEQAFALIHESYVDSGYMERNETGLRVRTFDLLPTTLHVIAKYDGKVVATMSIIIDSVLGLPLNESFSVEADRLRKEKRKIAEISSLTVKKEFRSGGMMIRLARAIENYAVMIGCTDILIAVSPQLTSFYKDVFLYNKIGDVRSYCSHIYDPVVLLHKSCRLMAEGYRQKYDHIKPDLNYSLFWNNVKNDCDLYGKIVNSAANPPLHSPALRRFIFQKSNLFIESSLAKISSLLSHCTCNNSGMKLPPTVEKMPASETNIGDRRSFRTLLEKKSATTHL